MYVKCHLGRVITIYLGSDNQAVGHYNWLPSSLLGSLFLLLPGREWIRHVSDHIRSTIKSSHIIGAVGHMTCQIRSPFCDMNWNTEYVICISQVLFCDA